MPGSVFLSWKKTPCGAFWGSGTVYRGQLCEPPTDHCLMFEHCGLTKYCNKRNSLSLCSDLNWVLMVSTFPSLFPVPSIQMKSPRHATSPSPWPTPRCFPCILEQCHSSPCILCPQMLAAQIYLWSTQRKSLKTCFCFGTFSEESKNTFKLKLSWKHENVKSHHSVFTLWQQQSH